jgi:hypothetical protein
VTSWLRWGRGSHASALKRPRGAFLDGKKAIELCVWLMTSRNFCAPQRNSKPTNNDAGGNEAELFIDRCDFSNMLPHTALAQWWSSRVSARSRPNMHASISQMQASSDFSVQSTVCDRGILTRRWTRDRWEQQSHCRPLVNPWKWGIRWWDEESSS